MPTRPSFTSDLYDFLSDLERNNRREWFQEHKPRYEADLKEPALQFIRDFAPRLAKISPHFDAIPKAVGGSLFRIYRDTRFSKDKTPYKTHCGIHFRHETAKDAHAPGFYLHIAADEAFVGTGMWHPDPKTAGKVRAAIAADPAGWKRAIGGKAFRADWELAGDSLKRPPRGFDAEHPLIEDLKRKDFMALTPLSSDRVLAPGFLTDFAKCCKVGAPLVKFICGALKAPY